MTAVELRTAPRISFDYSRLGRSEASFAEEAAERIRSYQRAASVDIGRELLLVKERLQHGDFIAWIEQECGFGRRTAVNLMQVAQRFGGHWESVSHLPPRLLYALAAPSTPDEFRQQILDLSSDERLDTTSVRTQLTALRRREAAARNKRRQKELSKGQQAYQRRKNNLRLQRKMLLDAEHAERTRQADSVAAVIADTLGTRKEDVLAGLEKIDPFRLVDALRKRLGKSTTEQSAS